MERPSKKEYYLGIAEAVLKRGTCLRRNYGAVIVNNDVIVGTGYSGAPRNVPNCIDIGYCEREKRGIPSGSNYELCKSVHAEDKAIMTAGRERTLGGVLYLAGVNARTQELIDAGPCKMCIKDIINAGIESVIALQADKSHKIWKVENWVKEGFIFDDLVQIEDIGK